MTTTTWGQALQNAQPNAGFQPLPPGQYRFRILSGTGKIAQTGAPMISVQLEVISAGPKKGRKVFHNWVLPFGNNDTDPDKVNDRLGFFLGDMLAFGITKEWLLQSFPEINKATCDAIGTVLVNRTCKATAKLQANDTSRNNFNGFAEDDGIDPPAPTAVAGPGQGGIAPPPAMPGVTPPGAPGGYPAQGGFPAPAAPVPAPAAPAAPAPAAPAPAPAFQPPAQPAPVAAPVAAPAPPQAPGLPSPAPVMPGMPGAPAAPPAFQPPAAPQAPPMPGAPAAPQASF